MTEDTPVKPTQIRCIDTLAGVHYPDILSIIPMHIGLGFFHEAFEGDVPSLVVDQFEAGRKHIRINILWDDDHRYGGSLDHNAVIMASEVYERICQRFPDSELQLAPFTEHNLTDPEGFLYLVEKYAPSCGKPVNSRLNGTFTTIPAYENEVHGGDNCPVNMNCSYSSDGTDSLTQDIPRKLLDNAHARRFCVWHPSLNLKYTVGERTDRAIRVREINERKPKVEIIQQLLRRVDGY